MISRFSAKSHRRQSSVSLWRGQKNGSTFALYRNETVPPHLGNLTACLIEVSHMQWSKVRVEVVEDKAQCDIFGGFVLDAETVAMQKKKRAGPSNGAYQMTSITPDGRPQRTTCCTLHENLFVCEACSQFTQMPKPKLYEWQQIYAFSRMVNSFNFCGNFWRLECVKITGGGLAPQQPCDWQRRERKRWSESNGNSKQSTSFKWL